MAAQILAGSTGVWKSKKTSAKGNFTVDLDTCSDCKKIPVIFEGGCVACLIEMEDITWTDLKTQDFQGA